MRILFVTATYLPTVNGVSLSLKLQKDELTSRGHFVTIVAPKHVNQKREKGVVRLPSLPNPKYPDYPFMLPLPYTDLHFKLLDKKYDLVYFHHPFYIGETAIILAKYFKCPTVFSYHTQYEEYAKTILPKQIPYKPIKKYIINHLKEICSKTDHIMAETVTLKNKIIALGIKTPVSVIASGRLSMKLHGPKKELRKIYNLPVNNKIILCVSRLSKEKNIETLIKMVKNIRIKEKFTLVLAGEGPQRVDLEKLTKRLDLRNIRFLGNVDYQKLPEIYSLADIFAYPSKTDTQAIVLVEAMTAGLPLIGFNSPGPKDFIVNNKNGLLCNNVGGFEKSLKRLILNQNLCIKMGKTSALYAKGYSFAVSMDKIEQTLKKIILKNKFR